jgi:hypothetical protein
MKPLFVIIKNLNPIEIEVHLTTLEETCKNLTDLVNKYSSKIDLFVSIGGACSSHEQQQAANTENQLNRNSNQEMTSNSNKPMSTSSSSSSAISSTHSDSFSKQLSQDDLMIKNMIVTNLVSYSYEIAHTVKRIVCAMGADN